MADDERTAYSQDCIDECVSVKNQKKSRLTVRTLEHSAVHADLNDIIRYPALYVKKQISV